MSSDKLKSYFLNILSKKDYSQRELIDKALQKGYEQTEIDNEIEFLRLNNYIDDYRMAENIIFYYQKNKGKNWLKQKMKHRKICDDAISKALEDYQDNPTDELKKQVENKYKISDWNEIDFKTKGKIANFLGYRGFSNPFEIISEWQNSQD